MGVLFLASWPEANEYISLRCHRLTQGPLTCYRVGGTAHEADFSCDVTRSSGRGLSVSGASLLGERAVLTDCDRTLWIWEEYGPNSGVEGHKAKEGICSTKVVYKK